VLLDSPPETTPAADPEALIEEARARQRRRRGAIAAAVLLVAAAAVAAYEVLGRSSSSPTGVVQFPNGPVVVTHAFAGHGRLAFVSDGAVYVVSEVGARKISLPAGSEPVDPVLSRDGRRLAFVVTATGKRARLWVANGDGSSARPSVNAGGIVGWRGRDLVVVGDGLELLAPGAAPRLLLSPLKWLTGAVLSPDEKAIAYTVEDGHGTIRLETIPTGGGAPTLWHTWGPGLANPVRVAGWWPNGIGAYVESNGDVPGLAPLDLFAHRGARPSRLFANAAINAYADDFETVLPAATPGGHPRTLETTIAPAWSPDGKVLAFANSLLLANVGTSKQRVVSWYANHPVYVYDAATGRTTPVPAAKGATMFSVAPGGRGFVFERENGVWLLPRLDGNAVRIAQWVYPHGLPPRYEAGAAFSGALSWAG
jgi:hypothetical protein